MEQVHGNDFCVVGRDDAGKKIPSCDCLITSEPGVFLVVRTADCMPISIRGKKVVALLHVGWRGLEKGIIKRVISVLTKKFKCAPKNLSIEIGPHICQKHYEIGDDVGTLFNETQVLRGKKYLSLRDVAVNQFTAQGASKKNIKIDKRCTFEDTKLPSYRRDTTRKGFTTFLNV